MPRRIFLCHISHIVLNEIGVMKEVFNLVVNKNVFKIETIIHFSVVIDSFGGWSLVGGFCCLLMSPHKWSVPHALPGYVGKLQQDAAVMSTLEPVI